MVNYENLEKGDSVKIKEDNNSGVGNSLTNKLGIVSSLKRIQK